MTGTSRLFFILCLFAGLTPLFNWTLGYLQGRNCAHFMLLLLPPALFTLFVALLCFIALLFSIGRGFMQHKRPARKILFFALSALLFTISFKLLPPQSDSFLLGFRDTIASRINEQQFFDIAKAVSEQIPRGESIWSIDKPIHGDDPGNVSKWKELGRTVDLKPLPSKYAIFNHGNEIEILWGGALTGHWGVRVSDHHASRHDRDYSFLPIANRIAAIYTD